MIHKLVKIARDAKMKRTAPTVHPDDSEHLDEGRHVRLFPLFYIDKSRALLKECQDVAYVVDMYGTANRPAVLGRVRKRRGGFPFFGPPIRYFKAELQGTVPFT